MIIGEWSIALKWAANEEGSQSYLDAQLQSYNKALGWYYWNFRTHSDPPRRAWSFENCIEDGFDFHLLPPAATKSEAPSPRPS